MKNERQIYQVSRSKKKTIYDVMLTYINKKYDIRFNEITRDMQISFKDKHNWEKFAVNSFLIELAQADIKVTLSNLEIFLNSHLVPKFNPIKEYFENLPQWDGRDHIAKLAGYLPLKEQALFEYHFKKWLVRSVKCRTTFHNDETGSVRWLCFDLQGKINFDYLQEVNINNVWAQAYHLAYYTEGFDPELTLQDILQNEERNKPYKEPSMEEELLSKYYEISSDPTEFMTASDIIARLNCVNSRLNVISMGKALKSRGFERIKEPKRQVYGYLVRPLFKSSPLELS